MAKRTATSELTHDNWHIEDEPEEVGTFKCADKEVLQQRFIKTAKRRVQRPSDGSSDSKPSVFAGFSGFTGFTTNSASSSSPYSFFSQNAKPQEEKIVAKESKSPSTTFSFAQSLQQSQKDSSASNSKNSETMKNSTVAFKPLENVFKPKENEKPKHLESLRDLNQSCLNWINKHLEKNPYIILTPIFKDYEKHLENLNLKSNSDNNEKSVLPPTINSMSSDNSSKLLFNINPVASTDTSKNASNAETASKPAFQFSVGSSLESNPKPFGVILPSTPMFSLNQISKPTGEADNANKNDEESDDPPKNDFVPVVEQDSIFDIRCKVFIKKDKDYISKGVGTLFIKPVENSNRKQLIVRADTSLGNVLLNFLLTPSLTIQKMGKNNVMVVCIPTPESEPPPVPVLIRVKTSEDCDNVIKKLEECKGC